MSQYAGMAARPTADRARPTTGFLDLLGPEDRADLLACGTCRRLPAGTPLFFEGDPAYDALLLLEGEVKVAATATNGQQVMLSLLGPGALIGELAPLDGLPRSASATALTPLEPLTVPAAVFSDYLARHPAAMSHLFVSVARKLRDATRRQLEWGTADALGRTCARLVELAERWGARDGDVVVVSSPVSQSDLAAGQARTGGGRS